MNVIKKVWGFVKPYIIKYYVAFFCGGVVWMFLDVYVTKGIDASFVSAVMDTVTAIVAVLAIAKAKQIWDEKGKDVGHKYAMRLLTEVVPTMQVSSSTLFNINVIKTCLDDLDEDYDDRYSSLSEAIDNKRRAINTIFSSIDKIKSSSIDEMNKLRDMCNDLMSQINMSGITVRDSIAGRMLKSQVEKYNEFTEQLMSFCHETNGALHFFKSPDIYNMHGGNYVSMENFMDIISRGHIQLAISRFEGFMALDVDLKDNLKEMKEGNYKSSDYFIF